ncbi:transcriptional coactivator p15/PC4 family protein [Burkholderia sp. Ac-20353]|uniref:transcriptional coactivator p15/PC4 family protein n=1 Tax=Burkholderia sp. Ac-20353 TaxID=2703894 RepID=UPI00197C4473|nr:transcriptional coactivator p15/PC4 family protein [Burkholderia sp. Ac-20353]MBN3789312.1 hypothetical protein [Burkholderia sp. Ac-20353]
MTTDRRRQEPAADEPLQYEALVLELQRGSRERLRIMRRTFRGRPLIDIRVWFVSASGDYQPSRSGVSIRPDQIGEIMQGLRLAALTADPKEVS